MKWEELSWILRGRLKKRVVMALDKPKTASILSKELKTHRSTISNVLKQMQGKELVMCLDPEQPYNRYYELTSKGKDVLKKINEF